MEANHDRHDNRTLDHRGVRRRMDGVQRGAYLLLRWDRKRCEPRWTITDRGVCLFLSAWWPVALAAFITGWVFGKVFVDGDEPANW